MKILKLYSFLTFSISLLSFHKEEKGPRVLSAESNFKTYLIILGSAQDGGYPQAGCNKDCCKNVINKKMPTCLGLIDQKVDKVWMFEATPAFPDQWKTLQSCGVSNKTFPDGIFLTHAHVGHYAGLMDLGREIMGTKDAPVYMMPRMRNFIRTNGPWSQLVSLKNISIQPLKEDSTIHLDDSITVTPFLVPHRDEFSETVGYIITTPKKKILFIPDIDKWEKWGKNIVDEVKKVDMAFIDGTFMKDGELGGRSMKDVPHPFVTETMKLFKDQPVKEKNKIYFIHFNHTNPINFENKTRDGIIEEGYNIANEGMKIEL